MKSVQVVEAKARFSALLAAVESGETVLITRHGKAVARLVPEGPRTAADAFRACWGDDPAGFDIQAPPDAPPEPVALP